MSQDTKNAARNVVDYLVEAEHNLNIAKEYVEGIKDKATGKEINELIVKTSQVRKSIKDKLNSKVG